MRRAVLDAGRIPCFSGNYLLTPLAPEVTIVALGRRLTGKIAIGPASVLYLPRGLRMRRLCMIAMFALWSILSAGASDRQNTPQLSSLPAVAQASISTAFGQDAVEFQAKPQSNSIHAENARNRLSADFTSHGVEVSSGAEHWRMALQSYGYGDDLKLVIAAVPQASRNRVEYRRGSARHRPRRSRDHASRRTSCRN